MKIVLAPDSFKGNLTSLQVATAMEKGIKRVIPNASCIKIPMADGGEGTVQSLVSATDGKFIRRRVIGPVGKPVSAYYGILSDGKTAIIEMAEASGLPKIKDTKDKNPMKTTTYGTGQLITDALDKGANNIIIGLGGSATVDGGAGMAQALGVRFMDKRGREIKQLAAGGMLQRIDYIDMSGIDHRIKKCKVTIASDVESQLCGKKGAAHVFGPQKGATPAMVLKLDENLRYFAMLIKRDVGKDVIKLKGVGAAGGLGAGMIAFTEGRIRKGIEVVIEASRLADYIKKADLVFTGEGCVDFQTAFGKTPAGVAKIARKYGVQTIVIGGGISDDARSVFKYGVSGLASACARDMSLQEAIHHSRGHLTNAAERALRLVMIGRRLERLKNRKKRVSG